MISLMRTKSFAKFLLICLLCCLLLTFLLSLSPILTNTSNGNQFECKCSSDENIEEIKFSDKCIHKLAVVVPFKDRFNELLIFVPHLTQFLNKQKVEHKIYVINQRDVYRFNRASLINIGFLISRSECDYMAMHDIDLIPLNTNLSYHYPNEGPFHLASPHLHPKYHYKTFVGGILLINREHFEKVNGLSNNYWGWGLEDDEFYARLKESKLMISRPEGITTGINDTFLHIHKPYHRRDTDKLFNQRNVTRRRDRKTGLNSVKFKLINVNHITIDRSPVSVYNVELICDISQTPWCQTKQNGETNIWVMTGSDDVIQIARQVVYTRNSLELVMTLKALMAYEWLTQEIVRRLSQSLVSMIVFNRVDCL